MGLDAKRMAMRRRINYTGSRKCEAVANEQQLLSTDRLFRRTRLTELLLMELDSPAIKGALRLYIRLVIQELLGREPTLKTTKREWLLQHRFSLGYDGLFKHEASNDYLLTPWDEDSPQHRKPASRANLKRDE